MKRFEKILFYLTAPHCVSCGSLLEINDLALCKSCEVRFSEEKAGQCSKCIKPIGLCTCTNEYLKRHSIKSLNKVLRYRPQSPDRVSNRLIFALKKTNRNDVVNRIVKEIEASLTGSGMSLENSVFVPIPRSRKSFVKYGYNHSYKLAKALAKKMGTEVSDCLVSHAKKLQKETGGEERMKNPNISVKSDAYDFSGRTVFLVDDIVTTGATMGCASFMVRSLGAKTVRGICIGTVMKDNT